MHLVLQQPLSSSQHTQKEVLLKSLKLTESTLIEALTRGLSARRSMTSNNPATSGGQYFYSETTRALRELLSPQGYKRESIRNVELTVNEELGVAIYLCGGCDQTGLENGRPQSSYDKGDFTLELFGLHQHETPNLDLFPDLLPTRRTQNSLKCEIWFLVHHIDKVDNSIRAELSRPVSFNSKGYVTGFDLENRIIIDMDKLVTFDSKVDFNDEIDINIEEI
ncbi:hypothetical protein PDPE_1-01334 [Photobacterium damselae subsp. piscicida]|uniref:hypothetical protein n=1 Tax=Photobacterium damselae TaxID=38293 RepID=UPI0002D6D19F|nr:hypothetical protein [Photobacterium damselae]BBC40494.1 hypothetical protein PDPE_1-01334 [Photobacterium damselae subsp. piscicida]